MKLLSGLLLFFSLLSFNVEARISHSFMPKDSVDFQQIGGKSYILHKVEKGEGLFSIARKYKLSVSLLKEINPKAAQGLKIGQLVKIPYKASAKVDSSTEREQASEGHVVQAGETLYAIARKHGVSTQQIVQANGLKGNALKVGQRLKIPGLSTKEIENLEASEPEEEKTQKQARFHVVKSGETIYALARQYEISIADIKSWNKLADGRLEIGQKIVVGYKDGASDSNAEQIVEKPSDERKAPVAVAPVVLNSLPLSEGKRIDKRSGKVTEVGLAELIKSSGNTNKYLAMHRSVPVGTIIHVKNQANKLSVFVRVIGKLPNTGANEKVLIKISQKAFDRLGGVDKSFPVELNYLLENEAENQ